MAHLPLVLLAAAWLSGAAHADEPVEDEAPTEEPRRAVPGTVHNPIHVRVKLLPAQPTDRPRGKSLDDHWNHLTRSLLDLQDSVYEQLDTHTRRAGLDGPIRVEVGKDLRVHVESLRDDPDDRAVRVRVTDDQGAPAPGLGEAWVETTSTPEKVPLAVAEDGSVVVEHLSSGDTAVVSVQVEEEIVLIWIDETR